MTDHHYPARGSAEKPTAPTPATSEPAKKVDGRRNNRPPVEHRIQPGEIRNPNGRRGKKAPKKQSRMSSLDEIYLKQGSRIVSHDADGPVNALQRLVQEDYKDAFVSNDLGVRFRARARLLENSHRASERYEAELDELLLLARLEKANGDEVLRDYRRRRLPIPKIFPHPDHIQIEDRRVWFNGPLDEETQKAWETIKLAIYVAAFFCGRYRDALRANPSLNLQDDLVSWTKHRRWLMRRVPKGWNWKEDIWYNHKDQNIVADFIDFFSEMSIEEEMRLDAECDEPTLEG